MVVLQFISIIVYIMMIVLWYSFTTSKHEILKKKCNYENTNGTSIIPKKLIYLLIYHSICAFLAVLYLITGTYNVCHGIYSIAVVAWFQIILLSLLAGMNLGLLCVDLLCLNEGVEGILELEELYGL